MAITRLTMVCKVNNYFPHLVFLLKVKTSRAVRLESNKFLRKKIDHFEKKLKQNI